MKKRKLIWKQDLFIEFKDNATLKEIEELEHDLLLNVTMNPHDFMEFDEVEEK